MSDTSYTDSVIAERRIEAAYWELDYWETKSQPFFVTGARLFPDGDKWCALFGTNIQEGVCGFGASPDEAKDAFNKAWYEKLPEAQTHE